MLSKEKRYTVGDARREDIPIYLSPCNDRELEVPLGRHQSFSFILGADERKITVSYTGKSPIRS